jgi:hypothetical protein
LLRCDGEYDIRYRELAGLFVWEHEERRKRHTFEARYIGLLAPLLSPYPSCLLHRLFLLVLSSLARVPAHIRHLVVLPLRIRSFESCSPFWCLLCLSFLSLSLSRVTCIYLPDLTYSPLYLIANPYFGYPRIFYTTTARRRTSIHSTSRSAAHPSSRTPCPFWSHSPY